MVSRLPELGQPQVRSPAVTPPQARAQDTTNTHSTVSQTPQGYLRHKISDCLESFTQIDINCCPLLL